MGVCSSQQARPSGAPGRIDHKHLEDGREEVDDMKTEEYDEKFARYKHNAGMDSLPDDLVLRLFDGQVYAFKAIREAINKLIVG